MSVTPFVFGSGIMWGIPLTDVNGTAIAFPTPQRFIVQDFSLDIDAPAKELTALNTFPLAVARSAGKITGKMKFANLNIGQLNSLFFGETSYPVAGGATQVQPISDEAGTPSANIYTVSVNSNINAANPLVDLGVRYGGSGTKGGQYLTRVNTTPTVGQYSVNATTGVYTFNNSDNNVAMLFDYSYEPNASTNQSILFSNHLLGAFPTWQMIGKTIFKGQTNINWAFQLNQVMGSKLAFGTKTTDFMLPELDFNCFQDGGGNIGVFSGQYY